MKDKRNSLFNLSYKVLKVNVKIIDIFIDIVLISIMLLMVSYSTYALWDSKQILDESDYKIYSTYKPTVKDNASFGLLKSLNPDVCGWLTLEGTNIDYPLVQAGNNEKYLDHNAKGEYSTSGSLFLDYRNNGFQDFNTIIYGHNMANLSMLGQLEYFSDKSYFDEHDKGKIFFDNKEHKLLVVAFIETTANEDGIYDLDVAEDTDKEKYLTNILNLAKNKRNIKFNKNDRYILLSTCSSASTNGRYLLYAKIVD